jgi:hypothetical protein
MGAIRAIDLDDFDPEQCVIRLRHRPGDSDDRDDWTPLKNGADGERNVNLSADLNTLIKDYVGDRRDEVTDRYGRQPLLTTSQGRPAVTTIQRDLYKMTRPCVISDDCPHDRDPEECDAATSSRASKCPSSTSPHPLRRWSIMRQLDAGVPKELLSDRVDVSVPVLEKHYDQRSKERKRERRKEVLDDQLFDHDGSDRDE